MESKGAWTTELGNEETREFEEYHLDVRYNSNLDKVNRKANYEFICPHCKKLFSAYGNKKRKYCSHACYIEDRFGGAE